MDDHRADPRHVHGRREAQGRLDVLRPRQPCERSLTLTSGQSGSVAPFGNWQAGSISGSKFHDLDADGTKDPGEGPLAGWTFYVDQGARATRTPIRTRSPPRTARGRSPGSRPATTPSRSSRRRAGPARRRATPASAARRSRRAPRPPSRPSATGTRARSAAEVRGPGRRRPQGRRRARPERLHVLRRPGRPAATTRRTRRRSPPPTARGRSRASSPGRTRSSRSRRRAGRARTRATPVSATRRWSPTPTRPWPRSATGARRRSAA